MRSFFDLLVPLIFFLRQECSVNIIYGLVYLLQCIGRLDSSYQYRVLNLSIGRGGGGGGGGGEGQEPGASDGDCESGPGRCVGMWGGGRVCV